MGKFVNISAHPCSGWSPEQIDSAKTIVSGGDVCDLVMPATGKPWTAIDPSATAEEVTALAGATIEAARDAGATALMVAGEPGFCFAATRIASLVGIKVYAATTRRESAEEAQPDGSVKKTSVFKFVQWRRVAYATRPPARPHARTGRRSARVALPSSFL